MKFNFTYFAGTLLLALALIITGCDDDNGNDTGNLAISSISPTSAMPGATVTINGTGFASTTSGNTVTFTGNATADVTSATASQLQVTVPQGAQDGPITVEANGLSATSSATFAVAASGPEIPQLYQDLPGEVIAEDQTWANDTTLTGPRFILPGVTLRVEAGVEVSFTYHNNNNEDVGTIITLPGDDENFSEARPSGRLVAIGTPGNPVVFTSERKEVASWGGIILAGEASNNVPGGVGEIEGLEEGVQYGAENGDFKDDDDSGRLSYVRIEYSGYSIADGSELQALTLYSVGSGTQLDHINLFQSVDDGIELFGGTVDVKYLVAVGAQDDTFDYDQGWTGRGQFWLGVQTEGTPANRGFENDGCDEPDNCSGGNGPTNPQIFNVTMYGNGVDNGEDIYGLYLREGIQGEYKNIIITNFQKSPGTPVQVADDGTRDNVGNSLNFAGIISFNNQGNAGPYSENVDPEFVDVSSFNFSLQPGSPALSGGEAAPDDGFFTPVTYRGAFGTEDWTQEGTWVRFQ